MAQEQPEGYLALPAGGSGPGVLVLHAWWGLNDTIKDFCGRLAEAGFVVFAPDLYRGKVADTIAAAEALAGTLDEHHAQAEIAQATRFLAERASDGKGGLAVVGFSLGAYYALQVSTTEPDSIRSVVIFYGSGDGDFSQSKAEYQLHFAEDDPYEPQENVAWLENELTEAGRPVTIYRYGDTGHWFFEPDRSDAWKPEAAQLAWERTLAFLRRAASGQ